jgi:hypothetical protein
MTPTQKQKGRGADTLTTRTTRTTRIDDIASATLALAFDGWSNGTQIGLTGGAQ